MGSSDDMPCTMLQRNKNRAKLDIGQNTAQYPARRTVAQAQGARRSAAMGGAVEELGWERRYVQENVGAQGAIAREGAARSRDLGRARRAESVGEEEICEQGTSTAWWPWLSELGK